MDLDAIVSVAVSAGLAADKAPSFRNAVIAADKKARDAAGSGLGSRELEERDQPKAQDRHAKDEYEDTASDRHAKDERESAEDERAEACDAASEAMDAEEEEKDKERAKDKAAEDRKHARDARRGARDARKGARDARRGARDSRHAKDRDTDPEHTNDEDYMEGRNPSTPGGSRAGGKTAVDSAEVDRRIAAAVGARDALYAARSEVEPILGKTAFDSAGATYREALRKLEVATDGVPDSALRPMLGLAKERASAVSAAPAVAMDSAGLSALEKLIPGYSRLR